VASLIRQLHLVLLVAPIFRTELLNEKFVQDVGNIYVPIQLNRCFMILDIIRSLKDIEI